MSRVKLTFIAKSPLFTVASQSFYIVQAWFLLFYFYQRSVHYLLDQKYGKYRELHFVSHEHCAYYLFSFSTICSFCGSGARSPSDVIWDRNVNRDRNVWKFCSRSICTFADQLISRLALILWIYPGRSPVRHIQGWIIKFLKGKKVITVNTSEILNDRNIMHKW